MVHAANNVTELHITCVEVLTAGSCICRNSNILHFSVNFVTSFYFLVLLEETQEIFAVNAALNSVSLKPIYLQRRFKLLDDVCDTGVVALVAYFVWF